VSAMSSVATLNPDIELNLKSNALEVLQVAWKASRRMETLSDDRKDAKAAERALAFIDKAFAELERKNP